MGYSLVVGLSLLAAQLLAGVASNGVHLGKRHLPEEEMRAFADSLNAALNTVFTQVIQKPLEDALAGEILDSFSSKSAGMFALRWCIDLGSNARRSRHKRNRLIERDGQTTHH